MADETEAFRKFAQEVRDSSYILLTKLEGIKTSIEENTRSRMYATKETDGNREEDTAKLLKSVRPETPKNVRGIYRTVTKDINRLRHVFKHIDSEVVDTADKAQVERIIQDLERQLQRRTVEMDILKGVRPKSCGSGLRYRMKSAKRGSPTKRTNQKCDEGSHELEIVSVSSSQDRCRPQQNNPPAPSATTTETMPPARTGDRLRKPPGDDARRGRAWGGDRSGDEVPNATQDTILRMCLPRERRTTLRERTRPPLPQTRTSPGLGPTQSSKKTQLAHEKSPPEGTSSGQLTRPRDYNMHNEGQFRMQQQYTNIDLNRQINNVDFGQASVRNPKRGNVSIANRSLGGRQREKAHTFLRGRTIPELKKPASERKRRVVGNTYVLSFPQLPLLALNSRK